MSVLGEKKRKLELEKPEATVSVSRSAYGQEVDREEKVDVPFFPTAPAYVEVEGSITRNQGNYNSARVAVSVRIPCLPEVTEIERAKKLASSLVDRYIEEECTVAGISEQP
jgi:hypothetical protein